MRRALLIVLAMVVAWVIMVAAWIRGPGDRPGEVAGIQFVDGTMASGVFFRHAAGRTVRRHMPEIMGSGVAIADFNRDFLPDILFVQSRQNERELSGNAHPVFLGEGAGKFRFSESWSIPLSGYGMGVAVGDYDNDGFEDVYLTTSGGHDRLLRNTGSGFDDVTATAGLLVDGWSTSAGFLDLEPDGDLDLYVVRYVGYDPAIAPKCYSGGFHVYCTPMLFDGLVDRVLINNGDGTFSAGPETTVDTAGKGLALGIADLDLDGSQDVYVANDTAANFLLLNRSGVLVDEALLAGAALSEVGAEEGSMGVAISDVTGDGRPDIACTNFQTESTSVYVQDSGSFFFREVSDRIGVGETARSRLSFGVSFMDADNDGDDDLLVANGHIEDNVSSYRSDITFAQPDTLYENRQGSFIDVTTRAGSILTAPRVSRGLATGDLDNDGRLDFVITVNDGRGVIGMNRTEPRGRFIGFILEGIASNRSGVGARVSVEVGGRRMSREVQGASSYLSHSDRRVHVGLGGSGELTNVVIDWPRGERQVISDPSSLALNCYYHVAEGETPRRIDY